VDLEVEGADLDAEGINREELVEGSSSEREIWKEKGRCTVVRRGSEATRRVASSDRRSSRVGQRRRREASHSLGQMAVRGEHPLARSGAMRFQIFFRMKRTRI
jgi:hypothetical protein